MNEEIKVVEKSKQLKIKGAILEISVVSGEI